MLQHDESGAPNIPKRVAKDKARGPAPRWRWAWPLFVTLAAGEIAQAVPVSIAWQVPVGGDERYLLEVAKDPGFGVIELRVEVRGTGFVWDTPEEGVYHWRLTRSLGFVPPESSAPGPVEGSTFVSGSFAAVRAGGERVRPARLTWDPEPGADSYKLYVLDEGVRPRTMVSAEPSFTVPASESDLMIEVVPYSGARRLFRYYHFNPTLRLDDGRPEPAPPPPEPVAEQPPLPPPEVVPAPVPAEAIPVPAEEAPPRPRVHLVHVYGLTGTETLLLQKLDLELRSKTAVSGGGGGVWLNPVAGLIVAAEGSYHEHKSDVAAESHYPGKRFDVFTARYTADVALGWDLLHGLDAGGHRLPLSFMGASAQLPHLPLEMPLDADGNRPPPRFERRQISLLGGGLGYGWLGDAFGFMLEGGVLIEESDDARMTFQRLRLDFYPSEHFAILLGAHARLTTLSRCAAVASVCLAEGKVKTSASEIAGFLGIGAVFR